MGLRKLLRRALACPEAPAASVSPFDLHKYASDGQFDYRAYRDAQIAKAQKDTADIWADPKTLDLIAEHARTHVPTPGLVLCHGSKSGMESTYLAEKLGYDGLGTDISPPPGAIGVVEWDFHELNDAWRGKAAVIYSNALDHAYDPKKALDAWVDQLLPGGLIYIEHTILHGPQGVSASDPFGAEPMIMPYLVLEWGRGSYCVREILRTPHKKPHWKPTDGVRMDTDLDIWIFVIGQI